MDSKRFSFDPHRPMKGYFSDTDKEDCFFVQNEVSIGADIIDKMEMCRRIWKSCTEPKFN